MTEDELVKAVLADQRRARRISGGQDVVTVPVETLRTLLAAAGPNARTVAREGFGRYTVAALLESA